MNFLINLIAGPIIDGVLKGLKEMRAAQQFEDMQGEILEGWMFHVKTEVERVLKANNVPFEVYEQVMNAINTVVDLQFDTKKL